MEKVPSVYVPLVSNTDQEDRRAAVQVDSGFYSENTFNQSIFFIGCHLLPVDCDEDVVQCDSTSPYRTYDGACNNLGHPTWGRTNDFHLRFLEASYEGKSGMRRSIVKGRLLSLPRDLSQAIFLNRKHPTHDTNFLFTVFGQIGAHDITHSLPQSAPGSCCSPELSGNSTLCAPIRVRTDDPFYSQFNVTCFSMVRSAPCTNCNNNGKWQQSNTVTAALDGSVIYGSTKDRALSLRTFKSGKLISEMTAYGELLPRPGDKEAQPLFCPKNQKNECFYSGDIRVNQLASLMSIQTAFLREHNRIADELEEINPHWDDETLYQEARKIVGAELQNIVYSEYLPALLGPKHMSYYNLTVLPIDSETASDTSQSDEDGYYRNQAGYRSKDIREGTTYDPHIRLGIWNEFTTAIFRIHSMIPTKVGLDHYRLRDFYSCPQLVRDGEMDKILSGASKVPSEKNDSWFTKDVTHFLLKQPEELFGRDLAAIDIQRGRDHGMPTYVQMLKFLSRGEMDVTEFEHLSPIMTTKNIEDLEKYYADVRDVDLFVGIQLENHVKGSSLGPTACAIAARQFYELKYGDRFYYEHDEETPSFTAEQRQAIRKSSLSRILCDNTDIRKMTKNALLLESKENPLLTCDQIPTVDLTCW